MPPSHRREGAVLKGVTYDFTLFSSNLSPTNAGAGPKGLTGEGGNVETDVKTIRVVDGSGQTSRIGSSRVG